MFDVETPPIVFPPEGVRRDDLLFRIPTAEDVPAVAPAFQDPDIGGRANMPTVDETTLRSFVPRLAERMERGVFLAVLVTDAETGEILGGASMHQVNRELGQAEIGYWLFPHARGRVVLLMVEQGSVVPTGN